MDESVAINPSLCRIYTRLEKASDLKFVIVVELNEGVMKKYQLKDDINVFGFEVKTFPNGIGDAFESLVKMVPEGLGRDFYGISFHDSENRMVYLATAREKHHGEAEKYQCNRYTIKKGDYATETVWDWRKRTDLIKHVFETLFKSIEGIAIGPCVEWYKDENEMLCMVRLAQPH
jgi:hypothetical protein